MDGETTLERARRRAGALAQPFLLVDYGLRFDALVRRSPPPGLRARAAGAADLDHLQRWTGAAARERLAHGHTAILAELDDRLAGCLWYAHGPLRAPGFGFRVEPPGGECYAYGLRVDRRARRGGVAAALFDTLVSHAGARDLHALGGFVSIHNRGGVRVQRAIGARPRWLLLGVTVRRRHALVLGRWRLRYAGTVASSSRRSGW